MIFGAAWNWRLIWLWDFLNKLCAMGSCDFPGLFWFEGFAGNDLCSSGLLRSRVFQMDKSVGFGLLEVEKDI
jgi:hypothetical protein